MSNKSTADVDQQLDVIHDTVFSEINCLECGNCCKTYQIILTEADQIRIGKFLGKDILDVLLNYHLLDDGQILVQSLPCPFLGIDNVCSIYEVRPAVCRDYPFLKSHQFKTTSPQQISENTLHCPATYHILERLKAII